MMGIAVLIAEILFWVFLLGGLFSRYGLGWKKFGLVLLILTPIVDLGLIALTYRDLASGESSTFFHGLSAYYVGFSLVFGHDVMSSSDKKFQPRFGNSSDAGTNTRKAIDVYYQDQL